MKKKIKYGILITLSLLLILFIVGFLFLRSILYPKLLVSGTGETKIACVGDSITYSQGVVSSRKTDAWPSVLARLLGDDYQTLNYGLPNRTLQSTGNMPYFDEELAKESLSSDAQIVIFMLGTNDTKPVNWDEERFIKEYKAAVSQYQQMDSNPRVFVMIPPRIFLDETGEDKCNNENLKNHLLDIIPQIAEELDVEVIDLYSLTENHPEWFGDGIHPTKEGNQKIAEYIAAALEL